MDLDFSGSNFTWCNGHSRSSRRWARLDRFLSNLNWISSFDYYVNLHLPRTNYDHSLLFLIAKKGAPSPNKIFHFDSFLLYYEGCHNCVTKAWTNANNTNPLLSFSQCVTHTRANIIKWKYAGLRPINLELSNINQEIARMEAIDPSSSDTWTDLWLRSLYIRHNALLCQNSLYWSQRA